MYLFSGALYVKCELIICANIQSMDKLQLTGQNLGRVFNSRSCHLYVMHACGYRFKLPNLKLKTRPEQLSGYLTLDIALQGALKGGSITTVDLLLSISTIFYEQIFCTKVFLRTLYVLTIWVCNFLSKGFWR